jgi:DNA-binding CsgD family transcriptional regulator
MPERRTEPTLRGRAVECEALDRLLARTRHGESGALVVCGPAGIGKSALLDYAAERAERHFTVVRARGVESEMELPFAGVHQLCIPMLDLVDRLPEPQAEALRTAFGLRAGGVPDRFLVALAVLSLLAEASRERPLLCVVDDAQWLDGVSAQALAFVARRLLAEPVTMLFGVRDRSGELAGLPELELRGLRNGAARALLGSVVQGRLDERIRDRIVAETSGNPLALLELPRGLSAAELAGGFAVPSTTPLASHLEATFQQRLQQLPPDSRRLALLAAAEPLGDPALLWRAASDLGLGFDAARAAEQSQLLSIGTQVEFRHPLVRSAIYRLAAPGDRRAVHAALAGATDEAVDPDRRAWHRAQAAEGADEEVAAALERSADRAQARGGLAAAAALLERATLLTPDPGRWVTRALVAARTTYAAGAADAALRLVSAIEARPLTTLQRATLAVLRAQIAFTLRESGASASAGLLDAARQLAPVDPAAARVTYLEAAEAATYAGRLAGESGIAETYAAAAAAPPAPEPPRAVDRFLDGLVAYGAGDVQAASPAFQRALAALADPATTAAEGMRWLWLAGHVAIAVYDEGSWLELADRQIQLAREAGALTVLPFALNSAAGLRVLTGEFALAEALLAEAAAISTATGSAPMAHPRPVLLAWRGELTEATAVIDVIVNDARLRGDGRQLTLAEYATAVLHNGLGAYDVAFTAAEQAARHDEVGMTERVLLELVEAATRVDRHDVARAALARLRPRTRAAGTPWALGAEACCAALVAEDDAEAERLYLESIEHYGACRIAGHRARAHLLFGEWLRRRRRRSDARDHLRLAYDAFTTMGAEAFAERARKELEATGEHARARTQEARDRLTPQEAQVARLAAAGASNQDIAGQLFISASTVAYHLRKVFRKLDITSRLQLADALPDTAA